MNRYKLQSITNIVVDFYSEFAVVLFEFIL